MTMLLAKAHIRRLASAEEPRDNTPRSTAAAQVLSCLFESPARLNGAAEGPPTYKDRPSSRAPASRRASPDWPGGRGARAGPIGGRS
eukprot:CAMPEP_0119096566 /NCGR_PEP_ID=MMETSP1178-20130426/173285_1 /TAXON_ID=33656 /ORGANISM="unid sp, Strain CCMP2000" /LENGTH=86 /DNA_ID=CAMNT_0007080455 /DNA_START=48 /DNA_END=305 /DNA_ORIENTATION=-